ncbi:hypothetical protein [Streptomyces sp. NPDC001770]
MKYRRPQRVAVGILVLTVATAMLIVMPLFVFAGDVGQIAEIMAPFPLVAYFAGFFYIRPYVQVTPREVIVRNFVTLYRIPRSPTVKRLGIRAVSLDAQGYGEIPALAHTAGITAKRQCQKLAAALTERPPAPTDTAPEECAVEKTRPAGAAEIVMFGATLSLCVLSIAGA